MKNLLSGVLTFASLLGPVQGTVGAPVFEDRVLLTSGKGGYHTYPNMSAIMLDDFFTGKSEGKRAILTVDELRDVRRQIEAIGRKLDILVTYYYARSLSTALDDYLELVDVVTLWGGAADLPNLDATLEKVETRIPNKRIMLGCYMFDFGKKEPISVDLMKLQCEKGLRWLRQGRIEGMIFLANTVADFDFPSVEWTRQWIRRIGDEKL